MRRRGREKKKMEKKLEEEKELPDDGEGEDVVMGYD